MEKSFLNIGNAIDHKTMTNIILNGNKFKTFPLKYGAKQLCPLSSLLFNILQEVLSIAIRHEKDIEGIQIEKEEVKLSLFSDEILPYLQNPKDYPKASRNNNFIQQSGRLKLTRKKTMAFLYTNNERDEMDIKKTILGVRVVMQAVGCLPCMCLTYDGLWLDPLVSHRVPQTRRDF